MLDRRQFLQSAATAGAGLATAGLSLAPGSVLGANDKIVVAVMGVNGRGKDHCNNFAAQPNVEIAYICDVDERAVARAIDLVEKKTGKKPKGITDIRKVLEDPAVDAISIATPDHWHAPATIMACSAGKHVYVEKPASHNAREGELAIAAARKYNKVVQLGTQRRSMPGVREAVEKVRSGAIGKVVFARGWYNNNRKGIGNGKPAPVPQWLDYSLWQGPAPERPFQDNLIHYNWHWFWNWGTGELGNNGIHSLDVCRWGLGVDYPERVTAGGGKYGFVEDDQETPDIMITTYHFGDKLITWEGRSRQLHGFEGNGFGVAFYGDNGTIVLDGGNYKVLDPKGKEISNNPGNGSDAPHFANFLECIRSSQRPNADIEEGVKSTMLCHLGNIAWRSGNTVNADPKTGHVKDNKAAQAFWGREYRKGWEPHV
jgi:predicted dehydrogenase